MASTAEVACKSVAYPLCRSKTSVQLCLQWMFALVKRKSPREHTHVKEILNVIVPPENKVLGENQTKR